MQSSSQFKQAQCKFYFKFELKSVWHRNTPPFILGYNSFKTKLYTAHNNLVVVPKHIPQILVPHPGGEGGAGGGARVVRADGWWEAQHTCLCGRERGTLPRSR
jgi:hypothetical protein